MVESPFIEFKYLMTLSEKILVRGQFMLVTFVCPKNFKFLKDLFSSQHCLVIFVKLIKKCLFYKAFTDANLK